MVTARSLSPGEEGALDITFDGRNRSAEQEKTVRVTTNDPEQETVIITIRAFVRTPLSLEPQTARVGPIGIDEERVVLLKLIIDDPEKISVKRIETSSPVISGRIVDDEERDGGKVLEVRFKSGRSPGKFEETLTLHTTSPDKPRIDVPVTGRVLGDIRLEPEAIGFQSGGKPNLEAKPMSVRVRSVSRKPFRITGLEDTTGFLRTDIEEEQPGVSYLISVGLAADGPQPVPASFNGLLRIMTDHPDQPVLDLPVYRSGRMAAR